jgi:hypothetical protein
MFHFDLLFTSEWARYLGAHAILPLYANALQLVTGESKT